MTVDLTADRTLAEAEFLVDSCTITRAGTAGVYDPDTLTTATGPDTPVYTGLCAVAARTSFTTADEGGAGRLFADYAVRVPMSVAGVLPGDVVTVTAVHDGGNPDLVNLAMVVQDAPQRTHAVLRRLLCLTSKPVGVPER